LSVLPDFQVTIALKSCTTDPSSTTEPDSIKRFASEAAQHEDWREAHFAWRGAFSWNERSGLYIDPFAGQVRARRPYETVMGHFRRSEGASMLEQLLYADRMTYLADAFLVKTDRMSMAHSLEVRPPMLDPLLASEAMTIPGRFKIRGLKTKWIIRELMRGKLPEKVLRMPKKGFTPPLTRWLGEPKFQAFVQEAVSSRPFREMAVVAPGLPLRLLAEHAAGRADHTRRLWVILGLALFAQRNARV
jgi:asparagine synthase (glutamine-hydrolysing)